MAGRPSCSALLLAVAIGTCLHGALAAPSRAQARRVTDAEDVPAFVVPNRSASTTRSVEPPPELPPEADDLTSSRLVVEATVAGRAAVAVRTVTRTSLRVHVEPEGDVEWLYVRNPVDARRVSAMRTDHAAKTIVVYNESDLRSVMGIRGWLDVLALGVDPWVLATAIPADGAREEFGLPFQHFASPAPTAAVQDVWWHRRELLPLEIVRREGGPAATVMRIRQRHLDVDPRRLALPTTRFPEYRQLDYADWLEGLHER